METELNIYCNEKLLGKLNLIEGKYLEFQYAGQWITSSNVFPLSVRLPLENKIYKDNEIRPFLENLLPESNVRDFLCKQFHISPNNIFGLLKKIGGDCAGAISFLRQEESPSSKGEYIKIPDEELDKIVSSLPKHPLLADRNLRLSLAGVQNKLPIYINKNQIHLTKGALPSSHILKPAIPHFPNTVLNEFFCMRLAFDLGLPVPTVTYRKNNHPIYIIERYDRKLESGGNITRIHQEDFCQALGLLSSQKYESEGGPSLEKCFSLIRKYSVQPAIDISLLINWVIFNYLIGNADAHGKNIAFIITEEGAKLSPFYDILCTQIYSEIDDRYAMKIGGENRPKWIKKRHWARFADAIQVKHDFIYESIESMLNKYKLIKSKILSDFPVGLEASENKFILSILDRTEKRSRELSEVII